MLVLGSPGFPEGGPSPEAPYPVTDCETMQTLIQAAGIGKLQVEAFLSKVRCEWVDEVGLMWLV